MINIIGHKYIFLTVSGILVLASFFAIGVWGLKLGIDFTGGSLLEVEFKNIRPAVEATKQALAEKGVEGVLVQSSGDKGVILRFQHVDEQKHQEILAVLDKLGSGVEEKRFDSIGPTIGSELKRKAVWALMLAIAAIILYIAWAFRRVSRPVSSWKYGVSAVLALIHDVTIPTGVFAVLGHFRGIEVDTLFITALLTILGFSVHDTIVVFDRTRENLYRLKVVEPFDITVNRSVNETMGRSINTSLTVLLVLVAVLILGGETVQYFALALIMGIVFGTYSSIFIASPLLVIWNILTKKT